jgi:hypothetical protein
MAPPTLTRRILAGMIATPLFVISLFLIPNALVRSLLVRQQALDLDFALGLLVWSITAWMAWRGIRYAFNRRSWNIPRTNSIKVGFGFLFLVGSALRPEHATFKAANAAEQIGMWISSALMIGTGILLIYWGISDKKKYLLPKTAAQS